MRDSARRISVVVKCEWWLFTD